jgi:hypothetical protein
MNDLTRSEIVKQSEIHMSDDSVITYNINITIETRKDYTIAYQQIQEFCGSSIDPIEQILVHLLADPSEDDDDQGDDDSIDDDDEDSDDEE